VSQNNHCSGRKVVPFAHVHNAACPSGQCSKMVQFVLALGSFSVVAAFVVRDLQEFHRTTYQDWGAIPPPQLIFSATYALASLAALLGINVQTRRAAAKAKLAV